MAEYHFYYPIDVRYGDLDPQGHVNNAKFLTYFEQARIQYLMQLGLFNAEQSFLEVGVILAETRVTFRAPIHYGQKIRVGMKISKIGNKSIQSEHQILDVDTNVEHANGIAVLVAYDYQKSQPITVPEKWRKAIGAFEGLNI